ncbi:hypothetical protein PFISCL1PPCAC_24414, partial [Pristionchus fissidentatus]
YANRIDLDTLTFAELYNCFSIYVLISLDGSAETRMTAGQEEFNHGSAITHVAMGQETVEEFKAELYSMQEARKRIVAVVTAKKGPRLPAIEDVDILSKTLAILEDSRTKDGIRLITSASQSITINIRDEIAGLKKDIAYLRRLLAGASLDNQSIESVFATVHLPEILAPHQPVNKERFEEEVEGVITFLNHLVDKSLKVKPIFITDWDGTMKNYCSQYATNLQPVYSAIGMAAFASTCTRLSAVLTAGPLKGPGILDLTALPIVGEKEKPTDPSKDGPIVFSGSWGREWRLNARRVLYDDGISEEGRDTLNRLNDEMDDLLEANDEFSQFRLVGSGVQVKVDRLTLGVQTVCNEVDNELSLRYQDAVRERMHRVDPSQQVLVFETATELEVEVCLHSSGTVWNKADGIDRLLEATKNRLEEGRVLIAGDTTSDLPMLQYAMDHNPQETFALFVGQSPSLESRVREMVGDDTRVCYISCPDVFHAGLASFLATQADLD